MSAPGKWGQPNFPKHNWVCVDIEDLGDIDAICQMCKIKEIRYVHTMEHPSGLRLGSGCVCAGRMEGSANAPVQRERYLKNREKRRANWMKHRWPEYESGVLMRRKNGCRCVLFPKSDGLWDGLVEYPDGTQQRSQRPRSLENQKRSMFAVVDAVL